MVLTRGAAQQSKNPIPCSQCGKVDLLSMVQCEQCKSWFHFLCVGVDKHVRNGPWSCRVCSTSVTQSQQGASTSAATNKSVNLTIQQGANPSAALTVPASGVQPSALQAPTTSNGPPIMTNAPPETPVSETSTVNTLRPPTITRVTTPTLISFDSPVVTQPHTQITLNNTGTGPPSPQNPPHVQIDETLRDDPSASVHVQTNPSSMANEELMRSLFQQFEQRYGETIANLTAQSTAAAQENLRLQAEIVRLNARREEQNLLRPMNDLNISQSNVDNNRLNAVHRPPPFEHMNYDPNAGNHNRSGRSSSSASSQAINHLTVTLNRKYLMDLPTFEGDIKQWPYFSKIYRDTTVQGQFSELDNIARLRKALRAPAADLVKHLVMYSANASDIMNALKEEYGRPDRLIDALTKDLISFPNMKSITDPELKRLLMSLNYFVSTVKEEGMPGELISTNIMTTLKQKLNPTHYREWVQFVSPADASNLEKFAEFVTIKVREYPPQAYIASNSSQSRTQATAKPQRLLTHQISDGDASLCVHCQIEGHDITSCRKFKRLSGRERNSAVYSYGLCISCLSTTAHRWPECPDKKQCEEQDCSRNHHPLLHYVSKRGNRAMGPPTQRDSSTSASESNLNAAAQNLTPTADQDTNGKPLLSHHCDATVLFKIVPVCAIGNNGTVVETFALLDDGSAITLMEKSLFDQLELDGTPEKLSLQWTKGVVREEDTFRTDVTITCAKRKFRQRLTNVYATDDLGLPEQTMDAEQMRTHYRHLKGIPFSSLKGAKPQILIGLMHAPQLAGEKTVKGRDNEPVATKTAFGWVIYGSTTPELRLRPLTNQRFSGFHSTIGAASRGDEDLHELVKGYFSVESFGVMTPRSELISNSEKRALEVMHKTLRFEDGRYEIGLLWRSDDIKLPDSYPMALSRLEGLERSLQKKPELLAWKNNHVKDLVAKGYAREATLHDLTTSWKRVWFCPTFVVFNMNKLPPKPRDVADVAAKVKGKSLNSYLLKGPDNLAPLMAGLFKFRQSAIAVNADVKEMFHQVRIIEEDQQCQRFLWRDGDASKTPCVYIMQRMMFGPTSSPACAQFVKNSHAEKFREECPEAVDGLTKRTYVDDYFYSHSSAEEALKTSLDAIKICSSMGMDLVGFQSNSHKLLQELPQDKVKSALVCLAEGEFESYVTKVLGMFWESFSDEFLYKLSRDELFEKMTCKNYFPTKRQILRIVMRIFDPLGLISHFLVRGRLVLQNIWKEGSDWDQPISEELQQQWHEFLDYLIDIENIRIPRLYANLEPSESHVTLVMFSDASEQAFATAGYFCFRQGDLCEVALIMAKSKVAPTKRLTIPQLELQSAVLGVRLADTIKQLHPFKIHEVKFLTDSTCVLHWVCSEDYKFKTFVAARVGEILESSTQSEWFHVSTKDNVADDATRWTKLSSATDQGRWFSGPAFLKLPSESWPLRAGLSLRKSPDMPRQPVLLSQQSTIVNAGFNILEAVKSRFAANWVSLTRVVAYLLRARDYAKGKRFKERFISPGEFTSTEDFLFRIVQQEAFKEEYEQLSKGKAPSNASKLSKFCPFMIDGIIRMSSRAQKAQVSYASKNPALLPNKHPVVDLFVQHVHKINFHHGLEMTVADVKSRAWILDTRSAVLRVTRNCQHCKIVKSKPMMPLMGQLPKARMDFTEKPFTHVGVDAFGPYRVKFGRGSVKRYGLIFTCLTYRAVHLEILDDMSTEHCIMAIRNFLVRRGWSRHFYSDNGKNFVGSNNKLNEELKGLAKDLGESVANRLMIHWHFIPAWSPWFGGAWERLIQSIKKCLAFTMLEEVPQEAVLRNAMIEAEFWMNRRPLTHVPIDHEDAKPLTPNAVLFGDDQDDLAASIGIFSASSYSSVKASQRAQHLVDKFLHRWVREYLPSLMRRERWHEVTAPVKIDDVAILIDPSKPKNAWSKCRVVEVHPGSDGHIRSVDVLMPDKTIKKNRSVGRIAVLDVRSLPLPESSTAGTLSASLQHGNQQN